MNEKGIKVFLRLALASAFLSAVADRFGIWSDRFSVWGSWNHFLEYTASINPWIPKSMISLTGMAATAAEIIFAGCLLIGFKTERMAQGSGLLLLLFALAMTCSTGIKGAFDYSVFTASAGAFALSTMKEKFWELDELISRTRRNSRPLPQSP